MMNQYLKELEQDPFDPDEFVERMVRRSTEESSSEDQIDPEMLHDIFTQAIQDLKMLQERQERKCARLEQAVQEEEKLYSNKLSEIMDLHAHCVNVFSALDERVSRCGGRALEVGEKLGGARAPRARAAAARDLLTLLTHFLSPGPVLAELFQDPSRLNEAADVIQKLHTISQELPADKFEVAKKKIEAKYDEIERNLIEEFVKAQNQSNLIKMKEIATIMTNFKGYSQCVDAYIETSQMNTMLGKDIFSAVLPLCKKNYDIISTVFPNPEQVMSKFVLNIFHLKLQKYIQTKLADKNDIEKYLKNLYDMYTSTHRICDELVKAGLISAGGSASGKGLRRDALVSGALAAARDGYKELELRRLKAIRHTHRVCDELVAAGLISAGGSASGGELRRDALVSGALAAARDGYKELELRRLKAVLSTALHSYYSEKQHVKKNVQGGGFQELRRDLQAVIGTRANINIAQIENYGGETFLSEQLVKKIINDSKISFQRCKTLCNPNDVVPTTTSLLDVLIQYLLVEHVDYALDLGLQSIPIAENKSPPQIYFFDTVKQTAAIIKMFEQHFDEDILPCVSTPPKPNECIKKRTAIVEQLETKLDSGLERAISAIAGWVKLHLQTEQKKTDFKPDGDIDTIASPACATVVAYLNSVLDSIHKSMEGEDLDTVTLELAVRLHRVIYEHLQNFTFNSAGAMIAICDIKEYRSAICGRGRSAPAFAHSLFDLLHALCNLLLVKPENLQQVCEGETLAELDRSILLNFIQLRSDYKSQKLANCLKGLS